MIGTDEFDQHVKGFTAERSVSKSDLVSEWIAQTEGDVQRLSDGDFALAAWIATHVAIVPGSGARPLFGGHAPRLSNVVIDEAQDVAIAHVAMIRKLLPKNGSMTLVGDLRQRVLHRGHFRRWQDLGLPSITRAVFSVNYRQSQQLGDFVHALHQRLFGELPPWQASNRVHGPKPRVRKLRGTRELARTVADEIRYWRDTIADSTVAVLYHGRWNGAKALRDQLEELLQDTLIQVHLARGAGRNDALRRTDCAIIATVAGTKGLEFDAVVLIDPAEVWVDRPRRMTPMRRNALYVGASRAKQGLSVLLARNSHWQRKGSLRDLTTVIAEQSAY
jgi:DNA helicase IV